MTDIPFDPRRKSLQHRLIAVFGAGLGCALGLGVGKLLRLDSLWLGILLVGGGTALGGYLAQTLSARSSTE